MQIELDSGKRVKVKAANVLLKFDKPTPAELIAAGAVARRRRSTSTWPGNSRPKPSSASPTWRATTSRQAPASSSRPPRCSACSRRRTTSAASARAASRRRRKRSSRPRCSASSARSRSPRRSTPGPPSSPPGSCPQPVREQLYKILFKPDKNAPEYKAVVEASRRTQTAPLDLLKRGRRDRFALPVPLAALPVRELPQGHRLSRRWRRRRSRTSCRSRRVQAFSIDDSATTEIDDALSVQGLGSGTVTFGIHIAAPGLAFAPERRSTRSRASACPPSTCRATSSPCCPTTWCRPTR